MNDEPKPLAVSPCSPPAIHCPLPTVARNLKAAIRGLQLAVFLTPVWFLSGISPLAAQDIVRLPTVMPEEQGYPGQLVSHPDSAAEILQAPGGTVADAPAQPPSDVRAGMFQKLIFNGTWLADFNDSRSFGQTDLESKIILALPCPTRDSPMVMTPGFTAHFLQGPAGVDLPPRLFDAYMQFRWLSQVTPRLGLDLAVTPGVYSDFDQGTSDALRVTGHAAAAWTWSQTTKIVLGAAYLDTFDINVSPVAGISWKPNEELTFDLIYPTPKISKRVHWFDGLNKDVETWVYIAGEVAYDSWAIAHSNGSNDQVLLSDDRLLLGLERKAHGGLTASVEVGYVFNRRIRFKSDMPDFYPEDTVLLRVTLKY